MDSGARVGRADAGATDPRAQGGAAQEAAEVLVHTPGPRAPTGAPSALRPSPRAASVTPRITRRLSLSTGRGDAARGELPRSPVARQLRKRGRPEVPSEEAAQVP